MIFVGLVRGRLLTVAAIGLAGIAGSAQAPVDDAPDAALKLAGSYVTRFVETFGAVIWREHYRSARPGGDPGNGRAGGI